MRVSRWEMTIVNVKELYIFRGVCNYRKFISYVVGIQVKVDSS